MKTAKRVLFGILVVVVLLGVGILGWFFGVRDGATLAYGDTAMTLSTYHLAMKNGDTAIAERAIQEYTGNVACQLLDGRHRFPPIGVFPARSEALLARLRAVWTPSERVMLRPSDSHPRLRRDRDYRKEFDAIEAATDVKYMARYLENEP